MILLNNAKETTTTVGTGILTLDGAVAGHRSLADEGGWSPFPYRIDADGGVFEIGIGVVQDNVTETGFELVRTQVLMTSVPGAPAALNLPAGTKSVTAVALAMHGVAENVRGAPADPIGSPASAEGSGAIAIGMNSFATGNEAIAIGEYAGATHDGSVVLGHTYSRGPGLIYAGARRDEAGSGPFSFGGDLVQSFTASFGAGSAVVARIPAAAVGIVCGRCELVVQDATDGNYVGALRWLVIEGSPPTLVVTEALTQIHSSRASPPSVTLSLAGPVAGEYLVTFAIAGGIAERFLLRTEIYGSP